MIRLYCNLSDWISLVRNVVIGFLGTQLQRAPAVSAIKVDGVPLHARVRRGEDVTAPERTVTLHACDVLEVSGDVLRVRMHSGKGYYVRAFARDLAEALGTVGHVKELRRTASGRFGLDVSVTLEALSEPGTAERTLLPLPEACACLPGFTVDAQGELDARCGRRVARTSLTPRDGATLGEGARVVLFSLEGSPLAIAEKADEEALRVVRGFAARG